MGLLHARLLANIYRSKQWNKCKISLYFLKIYLITYKSKVSHDSDKTFENHWYGSSEILISVIQFNWIGTFFILFSCFQLVESYTSESLTLLPEKFVYTYTIILSNLSMLSFSNVTNNADMWCSVKVIGLILLKATYSHNEFSRILYRSMYVDILWY